MYQILLKTVSTYIESVVKSDSHIHDAYGHESRQLKWYVLDPVVCTSVRELSGVIHSSAFNPFFPFVMKLLALGRLVVSWSIMTVAAVGDADDATAVCTKIAQTISSTSQVFYPGEADLKKIS